MEKRTDIIISNTWATVSYGSHLVPGMQYISLSKTQVFLTGCSHLLSGGNGSSPVSISRSSLTFSRSPLIVTSR